MNDDGDQNARNERARRMRNIALALVLGALVVLFFVMTIVRLKGHVLDFTQ
ncbi:MAG TPA: hypothetical protein VMD53_14515 [Rhizomicrobium sp.]|nr:hypothetical protein [Rhizomicrobium sp.]